MSISDHTVGFHPFLRVKNNFNASNTLVNLIPFENPTFIPSRSPPTHLPILNNK